MHILIVNSEYPPIGGGASNASAHLAVQFVKQGQQVTVLTTAFDKLSLEETVDGVGVIRLPGVRKKADRSTAFEQIVFMLSAATLGMVWVHRLRPDVVLAFFGAPSGVAAWVWSFFFKLPYVVSLRGGDVPGFRPYDFARQHRLLGPLLHQVWRRAGAVVANSEGLRQLAYKFDARHPVSVIPNGVDMQAFKDEERSWMPPRLLFVGRIVFQKGLDLLLDALAKLKAVDWELAIAGDGPNLENLKRRAQGLGIIEKTNFLGWQDRTNLAATFQQANLFVYPSRHEGMPNAVLEAMAGGLPVLATRIAGNEELVTEKTGRLVPPEDVEALQAALEKLLPDAQLRKNLGAAGRQRAATEYSWSGAAKAYLALMRKVPGAT